MSATKSFYFASCPREMEPLLEKEIHDLGVVSTKVLRGGVQFESKAKAAIEVLLSSRIASRVWKELALFTIKEEKDIYTAAMKLPWTEWMDLEQTFKIQTLLDRESNQKFKNSIYLSQVLKDGIVDNFKAKMDDRPSVEKDFPDLQFLLRIESTSRFKCSAKILVDLAGEPLSNRGYRPEGHKAPLRENLAAALIMSTDWDPEKDVLVDNMCGTGTILIEAILIKAKIRPSYLKTKAIVEKDEVPYAFMTQNWFMQDEELDKWFYDRVEQIHDHSKKALSELDLSSFYGSDLEEGAIDKTIKGLFKAHIPKGVVETDILDATTMSPPEGKTGILICNPPYGERLGGDKDQVKKLYHAIGENLKTNFKGFRAYVLTNDPELRKSISLQTSKRIPFFNGNLDCRLLKYDLY